MSYMCLILLLAGDVDTCPGPTDRVLPEMDSIFSKKGLKLFYQNVRGLLSNREAVHELLQSFPKIDIMSLSETHIKDEPDSMFDIPGYAFEKRNRSKGLGGGVGVYISDRINWVRRHDLEVQNIEIMWVEILEKNEQKWK